MTRYDWLPGQIEQLRSLWNTGMPTAEIGRIMCISKNAVIGKARRVGLDARANPIKRPLTPSTQPPLAVGAELGDRTVIALKGHRWSLRCTHGHITYLDKSSVKRSRQCGECLKIAAAKVRAAQVVRIDANTEKHQGEVGKMQTDMFAVTLPEPQKTASVVEFMRRKPAPAKVMQEPPKPIEEDQKRSRFQCRWPDGDRPYTYCCARRVPFKSRPNELSPYCEEHRNRAYKDRNQQDDEAA